ncbi:ribosome biogenesis protein ENP2 [Fistulifera solaris]|uniref:Ribosome biogenesis protein ENP2 n=1 Tax=Fistulifera solaris TaxID=1519565 RepID=A0A1Z5JKG3_FISSO|nr:ribosome biogenesis protein ENP2 [Fistulifera solaris]|eukprot:GAX14342.1 ribosome biogenesis protein ENP2 [Fistulifera solaris]
MNVQKRNGVSIYCLSTGTQLPEWLGEQARRNLSKRDESVRRRIELIQDFQMPASSSRIVQSLDGRYIIVAGTYPPRIRCYDVNELTMKFERYVDAGIIDMVMLGDDYGKVALLREDRTIEFHAPYGFHESTKIPTFGRAMAYEPTTCELLVGAKGNQIYRVSLDEGRFNEPWTFDDLPSSATCIAVDRCYPLASVGCEDGIVRFWDSRTPDFLQPFLKLDVLSATTGYGFADENSFTNPNEITSIAHDASGMYIAAGTGGGLVALYDVRSSRPLHVKEHKLGMPIHTVKFHSGSGTILSSDEKLIKMWRYRSSAQTTKQPAFEERFNDDNATDIGRLEVNIEATGKLSHFIVAGDESDPHGDRTGVLLCATDQPKMESFYLPKLGIAPKWCSFLENITEELEERDLQRDGTLTGNDLEGQETVYDNYKFVSREDVEKLGISNLVGTPLLRGYMHGFFIDINLYNRVKAVANPFEYEQYQQKKLKERMDAKRSSRIAPRPSEKKSKSAVNADLADRLEFKAKDSTKAGKIAGNILSDDRFGNLFTNPDFEIDEEDEDFKLRNPSGIAAVKRKQNNLDSDNSDSEADEDIRNNEKESTYQEHQSAIEASDNDSCSSDSDEDTGFRGGKVRGEAYDEMKQLGKKKGTSKLKAGTKKTKLSMYEAEDLGSSNAVQLGLGSGNAQEKTKKRLNELNMPLSKRLTLQDDGLQLRIAKGSKEVTYTPSDVKRKVEREQAERGKLRGRGDRRSAKGLSSRKTSR